MRRSTKMLLMSANGRNKKEMEELRRQEALRHGREEMEPQDRTYRRYSNGRFAPRNDMYPAGGEADPIHMGGGPSYGREPEDWFDEDRHWPRMGGDQGYDSRPIGFNRDWGRMEMGGADASVPRYREMDRMSGREMNPGHGSGSENPRFDRQTAMKWVNQMQNEDGSKGPRWTFEQARQIMSQQGIKCDPAEFWAALNMMYSDYCKVAEEYGVGDKADFYADMANAFLMDKDAGDGKLAKYYRHVVEG